MKVALVIYLLGIAFFHGMFGSMETARQHPWPWFKFLLSWPYKLLCAIFPKNDE
jgi:hypothetical protein